jgi:LysR family carnitine catabolism transcriptional activator
MDLRRLRLFLAVVDNGGFTAAARAEHVAQPAVSLAVRELETEVGAPLLVRSRTGVALTAAGEALVPPARQALRDLEHAADAVAAVTGLMAGRLDLVSLPTLAADPVAGLVGEFRRAHPGVTVHIGAPNDLDEVAGAVRSGAAELGITEQGSANAGLDEVIIGAQELLLVAPPGRDRVPTRIERMAGLPLVLSPPGSSLRDAVAAAFADAGLVPEVAVETAQREALIPLVLSGAGLTFLPRSLATAAQRLGARVRTTTPKLERTIVLIHRPGTEGPATKRFKQLATGET